MTYTLAIGDRAYSTWSLRGWLMFQAFGIPFREERAIMRTDGFHEMLLRYPGAKTVPAVKIDDAVLWDSMAIGETLAERHAGLWPDALADRALARTLAAEMHSGFMAMRSDCPMNLHVCYQGFVPSDAVKADLARAEELWLRAFAQRKGSGPWLFGSYSLADVMYAPLVMRIAGYQLPVQSPEALDYIAAHLSEPHFRQWRAMALAQPHRQAHYHFDYPLTDWPGPDVVPAEAVADVTAINDSCPYSGEPVDPESLARIDGVVIGYCNTFCRDKTVADPAAWPKTMALLEAFRG